MTKPALEMGPAQEAIVCGVAKRRAQEFIQEVPATILHRPLWELMAYGYLMGMDDAINTLIKRGWASEEEQADD